MLRIKNDRYQESYVEETLENGLHVVLWQKEDYEKSLFMMATPLGAMDMQQVDEAGTTYDFPAGIAHFLEHKMFEMGEQDVMDQFSKMGANVNAFTSYSETAYYFSTSGEIIKPLNLLLDFVQSLDISEESVEKEKGIIIQELNMYQQMSDSRLLMETFSSLYVNHPLKYDIGGDSESVNSITLEQLQTCYKINYHPSSMVLVGVSKEDPERLLAEIKRNQSHKQFDKILSVKRQSYEEPANVARENFDFKMDVTTTKLSIAYKFGGISDVYRRMKTEWCIKIMLDAYFSSLNPDYQTWMDDGIINDYVGSEIDLGNDYGMIMFYGETDQKDAFLALVARVMEIIKKGIIDTALLEQLKRRYFGQSIRSLNSFDDIAVTFIRTYFDGADFFKAMDILYEIDEVEIKLICEQLDVTNQCCVTLLPEEK